MKITFTQKSKQFFNDYYGWILLITGIVAFILIADLNSVFKDFTRGFYDGFNGKNAKKDFDSIGNEANPITDIIGMFFVLIVAIVIVGAVFLFIGHLFYVLFFKYILQKNNALYITSFLVWLCVIYNLSYEAWIWIFNKNNAFEDSYSTIKNIIPKSAFLKLITDRRENEATLVTFLILLIIILYGLIKNYIQTTKTQAKLIAQKSQAELAALKAQINPHFLFNVLNNLYGTAIVEESPKTSEGILQLSSIMRHVVEGTKNEKIELEKEIRFLNDYIDLSKIRIPNRPNIRIGTKIDTDETPTMIAPLLVIPYLENAFKYGISMNEECFIEMSYIVKNQQLEFVCRNSIIKTNDKLEVGTGTGLENTQKRLDLYYPSGYQLSTSSVEGFFMVKLSVNLSL